jgi:hypothetical protein
VDTHEIGVPFCYDPVAFVADLIVGEAGVVVGSAMTNSRRHHTSPLSAPLRPLQIVDLYLKFDVLAQFRVLPLQKVDVEAVLAPLKRPITCAYTLHVVVEHLEFTAEFYGGAHFFLD